LVVYEVGRHSDEGRETNKIESGEGRQKEQIREKYASLEERETGAQ